MDRISVVIPAYNEEELLSRCIEALSSQAREARAEIIVVDNDSSDRTALVARQFGATVVHEPRRGYVFALSCGIRAARHPIIAATDADSVVCAGWLAGIQAALACPGVSGVTGPVAYEGSRMFTLCARLMPHELWGANMAFRKADLDAIGGMDAEVNIGADIHLNARLKERGRIVYDRKLVVTTSSRRFLAQPVRQTLRYALNYGWIKLFRRPLFWSFAPFRESPDMLRQRARRRATALGFSCAGAAVFSLAAWPSASHLGGTAGGPPETPAIAASAVAELLPVSCNEIAGAEALGRALQLRPSEPERAAAAPQGRWDLAAVRSSAPPGQSGDARFIFRSVPERGTWPPPLIIGNP